MGEKKKKKKSINFMAVKKCPWEISLGFWAIKPIPLTSINLDDELVQIHMQTILLI